MNKNIWRTSALASKIGLIKKMKALFLDFTHFLSLGQKSKNNFVSFLVQMRTRKFASEIYWSLGKPIFLNVVFFQHYYYSLKDLWNPWLYDFLLIFIKLSQSVAYLLLRTYIYYLRQSFSWVGRAHAYDLWEGKGFQFATRGPWIMYFLL